MANREPGRLARRSHHPRPGVNAFRRQRGLNVEPAAVGLLEDDKTSSTTRNGMLVARRPRLVDAPVLLIRFVPDSEVDFKSLVEAPPKQVLIKNQIWCKSSVRRIVRR